MQFCVAQDEKHFCVLAQVEWKSSGLLWLEHIPQSEADDCRLLISPQPCLCNIGYCLQLPHQRTQRR